MRDFCLPLYTRKAKKSRSSANRERADVTGAESSGNLIGHRHGGGDPAVEHDPHHVDEVHYQGPRHRHSHHFVALLPLLLLLVP